MNEDEAKGRENRTFFSSLRIDTQVYLTVYTMVLVIIYSLSTQMAKPSPFFLADWVHPEPDVTFGPTPAAREDASASRQLQCNNYSYSSCGLARIHWRGVHP